MRERRGTGVRERRLVMVLVLAARVARVGLKGCIIGCPASTCVIHLPVKTHRTDSLSSQQTPLPLHSECVVGQCVHGTTYTHCICLEDFGSGEKGAYLVFHRYTLPVFPFNSTILTRFPTVESYRPLLSARYARFTFRCDSLLMKHGPFIEETA